MTTPTTLFDRIAAFAAAMPSALALTFLKHGDSTQSESLTWLELDHAARSVARQLESLGPAGSRAIVACPQSLEYAVAFYGCMYAGWIPVPAPAPSSARRDYRLSAIADDAEATVALTTGMTVAIARASCPQLTWIAMHELSNEPTVSPTTPRPASLGDIAFLQYTSGSTSQPKGVVVTHRALLAQLAAMEAGTGIRRDEVMVSWLPLYHDYGLVGHLLLAAYTGAHLVLMSPATMLRRPAAWLETITRFRATVTGAPNFALDLCCRRISDLERAALDLSSLRTLGCGGEPVRPETITTFHTLFGPVGLLKTALTPAYGMAESVLALAYRLAADRPVTAKIVGVSADALASGAIEPTCDVDDMLSLVSNGVAALGVELRIVNPETLAECAPGCVGEIWARGESIAAGYWRRPEDSREVFGAYTADGTGPWLRTGDLGALVSGELFVTGRRKEVIIVRGHNHYPVDIERTAQDAHDSIEPAAGAAFGVVIAGEEHVVLVQEVSRQARRTLDAEAVITAIKDAVTRVHGIVLHAVVLVDPLAVPKTSSGKVQRVMCRELWLSGELTSRGSQTRERLPHAA